jgi:hypothetical protein
MGKNKNNAPKSSKKKAQNLGETANLPKGAEHNQNQGSK